MNRKRKINELYKGVFKNDKKSCLIDLKPLDKKRELERKGEDSEAKDNTMRKSPNKNNQRSKVKSMNISLKVDKHMKFGTFFKREREEIIDIFKAKEDFISYEGLINSGQVNALFNLNNNNNFNPGQRDSINKIKINEEIENIQRNNFNNSAIGISLNKTQPNYLQNNTEIKNQIYNPQINNYSIEEEDLEILYEDEMETIYKKKKPMSRRIENITRKNNIAEAFSNRKSDNNFYYPDESSCKNIFDISNIVNLTQKARMTTTHNRSNNILASNQSNDLNPFIPISDAERNYFKRGKGKLFMDMDNHENLNILNINSNHLTRKHQNKTRNPLDILSNYNRNYD